MRFFKSLPLVSQILFAIIVIEITHLIFQKGDRWDLLNHALLCLGYFGIQFSIYRKTKNLFSPLYLFIILELIFLGSLNRVEGYPDRKDYLEFYQLFLFIFILGIFFLRYQNFKTKLLLFFISILLIFYPFFVLPGALLRQIINVEKMNTYLPAMSSSKPLEKYSLVFTKEIAAKNEVIALFRYRIADIHEKQQEAVFIFQKREDGFLDYKRLNFLISACGGGTMDCQVANIPFFALLAKIKPEYKLKIETPSKETSQSQHFTETLPQAKKSECSKSQNCFDVSFDPKLWEWKEAKYLSTTRDELVHKTHPECSLRLMPNTDWDYDSDYTLVEVEPKTLGKTTYIVRQERYKLKKIVAAYYADEKSADSFSVNVGKNPLKCIQEAEKVISTYQP